MSRCPRAKGRLTPNQLENVFKGEHQVTGYDRERRKELVAVLADGSTHKGGNNNLAQLSPSAVIQLAVSTHG